MKLTVIGLNHHTAPLAIREKIAFPAAVQADAVRSLAEAAAAEAVILSTCNRTELYCVGDADTIIEWLADYHGLNAAEIRPYLYVLGCSETIRHAFRVSCGLDSMVLGEPQILGQMKQAVRTAREQGSLGTWLNGLFQRTFATAKEVRSRTRVGDSAVSMASVGLKLAVQTLGSIGGLNVLFVGAGEMIELVAPYFADAAPAKITVANRSLLRAETLCAKLGGSARAVMLDSLPDILHHYDIVIASTAAESAVISRDTAAAAQQLRGGRRQFVLDLAVARDIEAEAAALPGISLFTVDDIAKTVRQGKQAREQAAAEAEQMVEIKVAEFIAWQQSRQRVPLICALRSEGERARRHVLDNAMRQLAKGAPPEEVLERLSVQLTNKLLHSPTRALNKADVHDTHMVNALAQIYSLGSAHR